MHLRGKHKMVEIIEKKPLSLIEVKDELMSIKKRDGELNFRAGKVEEYLNNAATLNKKQSGELREELEKLSVPRLKEEHICKLIDILPFSEPDLVSVLEQYPITITKENQKKIVSVINKFRK